jgi:hypothetical protein
MSNFLNNIVNKALDKVDVVELVDGAQDGLMKVHEFVGHAADVVSNSVVNLGLDMQDGIMYVSEALEEYAGLVQATAKAKHFAEPGKPVKDEVKADTHLVEGKPELKPDAMTRAQMIDYLSKAYAIDADGLKTVNEKTLRNAVEHDQQRRNERYNNK